MDPATTLGPLSIGAAIVQLVEQVDTAIVSGARVVTGGKRLDRPGAFMQPTILTDIAPDNPAFRSEFFGPVAFFYRVKDEDAAITLAHNIDWTDAELPFGGIKNSRYGRELSDMGIQQFVNKKLVRTASMTAPA